MGKLSNDEVGRELAKVSGWELKGDEISRTFEFRDFADAMGFAVSVGHLAEKANHHPDIDIRWNKVTLVLSTHSEGGLTAKDFELAGRIARIGTPGKA